MLAEKDKCTGCSACYATCNYNGIKMIEDEAGFKYPRVDYEKCVGCFMCTKACPVLNNMAENNNKKRGYILQNKDKNALFESTSGAVFPEIAKYIIELNGRVYGAAFDNEFCVRHIAVEDLLALNKLKKSKYVQSDMGDIYRSVKADLISDRHVCFSGTPCQVEGLLSFLGKEYPKLVTIDVVCHGVASPLLWRKYISFRQKSKVIKDVCFRDKSKGYQYSQMNILYEDGSRYLQGTEYDQMLRAFFSDICDRESCYHCSFKKIDRVSDFTIWDSFDNSKFNVDLNENVGTSKMIVHTEKGCRVFEAIKERFFYKEVDSKSLVDSAYEMTSSVEKNMNREKFLMDLNNISTEQLINKYFPINTKVIIKKTCREILYRLQLYTLARRLFNRMKAVVRF
ncbi:Coenzyme F420 hydrogenase/dehydrogenase, beta subunit C-terminal domain [Butyrivibrio sp. NC2002]|uniref:Coenzyme F420 hydrogenase/dehydrogenase, beta subunit C-terminal domain n=1 Tax=Butyrivibrio sp. NC2002 TaxID=1410610 RepID=UPI00068E079C|nr:Coenzyme F420 hydrogenase/dehydrogenase, beta subunit C-terminal domain [Butyrivibrio sp. NC2002]